MQEVHFLLRRGEGFYIIPLDVQGQPLLPSRKQHGNSETETSLDEVRGWLQKWPGLVLGTATGRGSLYIVVRVRKGGDIGRWPSTTRCERANGDTDLFFWHPGVPFYKTVTVMSKHDIFPFTDVIGEDDFVVLPPSIDGTGAHRWIEKPNDFSFAHLYDAARFVVEDPDYEITNPPELLQEVAAKEFLNTSLRNIPPDRTESVETFWKKFKEWNADYKTVPTGRLSPAIGEATPYSTEDLRDVFDETTGASGAVTIANAPFELPDGTSIHLLQMVRQPDTENTEADDERVKARGPSQSTRLVNMVLRNRDIILFKDEYGDAYVRIPIGDHAEIWPCHSSSFSRWLGSEYYKLTHGKTVAGREAIKDAISLLEGRAINEGEELKLYNRVAKTPDALWYDMGDSKWTAVRVTKDGWNIVKDAPILFRRFSHLDAQVAPVQGGSVLEVLPFVNIVDPNDQLLFLVHLVSTFIPGWPHPALYVYGPQGSAKSTLSRIDRKLIDPSKIEVVNLTRNEAELAQQLGHHYYLSFDNVSEIPNWISDLICRAVTGSGFSKRALYTDNEDVISYVMANIGLNGINIASNRADLLERCLLIKIERMKKRKQEEQLMAEFENARPRILGGIFDILSKALALKPNISVAELPRMADFALWGSAIAEAIERNGKDKFLRAYLRNVNSQSEIVVNDNNTAMIIRKIIDAQIGAWESSPTELFKKFKATALDEMVVDKDLPGSASVLMRELNRLKTAFGEMGYQITQSADRSVVLRKVDVDDSESGGSDTEVNPK